MSERYEHLGGYSDWVAASAAHIARATPRALSDVRAAVRQFLHVPAAGEPAPVAQVQRTWSKDGVDGEELSWSVGFGPPTKAWLLKPTGAAGPLPGIVALHGHDGFKFYGKEKIADGPDQTAVVVTALRERYYDGRAFANELALEGFVVLAHDVFGWGSRAFRVADMPPLMATLGSRTAGVAPPDDAGAEIPADVAAFNAAAWHHENVIEKYCRLLGTTFAAVVAREDRIALAYLRSRSDTTDRLGSIGLSGGGCRSALLRATSDAVSAAVVVGMMCTYDALLDRNVVDHTWMLMPAGLPAFADWPDVAACGAPAPLLVQYDRDDELFPLAGQQAAHERIAEHYVAAGAPQAYTGQFYNGAHKFDMEMQRAAFEWLARHLLPR